jgi:hypothetical protein
MLAKIASTAGRKGYAVRNAQGLRQHIANSAKSATIAVQTSLRKFVPLDSESLMSVIAASRSVNVP